MKDIVSFPLLLIMFGLGSSGLHWLVNVFGLSGLAAFMVYCIPLLVVISYTTMEDNEIFWVSLFRNACWAYSFILGVAGVAWIIGWL